MGVSSITGKIVCFFFIFSLFGFVFCFCFCFGVFFVCCLIFFCIHVSFYYFGFICFCVTGGGRIRDVASLIRRTDEPEIKKIFWGGKSKKTFSPEAKKIF